MKDKTDKNYNTSNQLCDYNSSREAFAKELLIFWKEISKTSLEGKGCLDILTDELQSITPVMPNRVTQAKEFNKLFSSLRLLETSHESSKLFNQLLHEINPIINWYPNNVYEHPSEAIKRGNYCANLVGKIRDCQRNPFLFNCNDILVGLFLLGPHNLYPEHKHPASEMWVVLSGQAKWKRGKEEWIRRKAGEYFIHTPNESHAMQTFDEPLLAIWAWTGDLDEWAKWSDE
ncbi:MAG: dimethylsulfonioproprionate lyase family protein [Acidaminobacteraceae bacterium]